MGTPFTVVDAFTDRPFAGNPAAVMLLDAFPDDQMLTSLAAEHQYAETAFLVRQGRGYYHLRWFTPTVEVPLCGHGTLAASHALYTEHGEDVPSLRFDTASGQLNVSREGNGYKLDFPIADQWDTLDTAAVAYAIGVMPSEVMKGKFLIAVVDSEETVRALKPDLAKVAELPGDEIVVTAPGIATDFVSRMFGPKIGIPEDPFTGATHTMLAPYWAARLGKSKLSGHQASARGGDVVCEVAGERVFLFGNAVTTMRGQMAL
ncbi:MAG: PhzF family phenazine biosynthesis protein [Pseudomonadota bacterium]